jgi:recombinational DNA repair protein (RecF pathway)
VEILYKRLYRAGRSLAGEWTRAETAYEFTSKLMHRLSEIGSRLNRERFAQQTRNDVQRLTDLYQSSLFGRHTTQTDDVLTALQLWKHVRFNLFIARMNDFFLRYKRTST